MSVAHSAVHSKVNTTTLNEAWLTVSSYVTNHSDQPVTGTLCATIGSQQFATPVTLAAHEQRLVRVVSDALFLHPRLWWCHNMGKPELYDLHVEFYQNDRCSDAEDLRFGIRQIESFLTPEGHRSFKLNGKPVLLRGAGWTDDIYLRDTPATNRLQLQYVRHMNMNTVRFEGFWGTSQNLYDLCDELGLLVLVGWSCHWEWEEYLGAPCPEPYGGIVSQEQIDLIAQAQVLGVTQQREKFGGGGITATQLIAVGWDAENTLVQSLQLFVRPDESDCTRVEALSAET